MKTNIVTVQYKSHYTGEFAGKEYSYFTANRLAVGDIVEVPARDSTSLARVARIDVEEREISSIREYMKTITGLPIPPDKLEEDREAAAVQNSFFGGSRA